MTDLATKDFVAPYEIVFPGFVAYDEVGVEMFRGNFVPDTGDETTIAESEVPCADGEVDELKVGKEMTRKFEAV
jgi:hypothetical protein